MVPPRSNRVSRAPPYSRTRKLPYPYRAVTVCGAPFQTLPVRVLWPLAWSAFARRYLRSRCCCPFLRLLRCFSSPGSPRRAMDSLDDTAKAVGCPIRRSEDQRALAPPLGFSQRATSFIASRCQGIHQMPLSCVARAQPQARGQAACRDQMSEVRGQKAPHPATRPRLGFSDLRSPISGTVRKHRPCRCSRIGSAYPCPGPTSPRGTPQGLMAGPASRSRLASRCQKGRCQRPDVRRHHRQTPPGLKNAISMTTMDARGQKTPPPQSPSPCRPPAPSGI